MSAFLRRHRSVRSTASRSSSVDSRRAACSSTYSASPLPSPISDSFGFSSSSSYDPYASPASPYSSYIDLDVDEPCPGRCENVVFDLGDVLFTWSAVTTTSIAPKTLKKILRSSSWFEYEKGNVSEGEAYARAAFEFGLDRQEVKRAFQDARASLRSNPAIIQLIRDMKAQYGVRVFAMSNISVPDFEFLRTKASPEEWALFDRVFTSGEARERKPNLGFYKYVLSEAGVDPLRTVFVDDKLENVLPARSLGIKGIVFDSFDTLARQLRNYLGDSKERARGWLKENAKKMLSVTNTGMTVQENFAPLLIYEATGDRSLVEYVEHPRLFNFFIGGPVMTSEVFPADLDTTSIGLTVSTHVDYETKMSVMDEMLTFVNKDGIIQTYFDSSRPRTDPIVCVNVLTFFHMYGRGHELAQTLSWVYSVLKHRAYVDGTLYYHGGDTFLFFLSRLLSVSPHVFNSFAPLFRQRVFERSGAEGDAQQLAMRVIAGAAVGVRMFVDYERLVGMQEEDGAWPMGWAYKYGGSGILLGNKGWTTALAVKAIEAFETLDKELF